MSESIKPGSIYRIALENFVTYKQVELFPGSSLNLIIGPNGTGKSTFVCAIILGLCGKTNVIGRSKKISDFVRSGCQEARIEIELHNNEGEQNITITRIFTLEGTSSWYIDRKTAREKQVMDIIATFNIQVDNLCQMLPQDRVQDFSKMDAQQLLRSTLAAVGGSQSVQQLDDLIASRTEQRELGGKTSNAAQMLQEQIRLNERLKVTIDAMQERKEIEKNIQICETKKLWLQYEDARRKVMEYVKDQKDSQKIVKNHQNKLQPLEDKLEKSKSAINSLEQEKLAVNRKILSIQDKSKETLETIKRQNYIIKDVETSYQEVRERQNNRQREIEEAKTKRDKLVNDKDRLVETIGDEEKVKMELAEIQNPLRKTNMAIEQVKKQKLEIQHDLEINVQPQIRMYQSSIKRLGDVDRKRLEVIRNFSEDCYQAVLWYRENKDMFESPSYQPMVLEINFTDPKFANYLENTIANRDIVAFIFEATSDMNRFLQIVRGQKGWKRVNAICSQHSNALYQPPVPIDELSYLGFYTYLVDTITAPDAIKRYLCKQYHIHRIPIGNDHTFNNSAKVPANISFFYTAKHRFVVRVSAYSGIKSSSTVEIRPAKLLANTVDMEQLNNCKRQLNRFVETSNSHATKIDALNEKLGTLESYLNELYSQKKKITECIERIKTIYAQIRLQTKKIRDMENEPAINVEQEKKNCRKRQRDAVMKQCKLQKELRDLVSELQNKLTYADICKVKLELSRNAILDSQTELREMKTQFRNAQSTLENIENLLTTAKTRAKSKLTEAKSQSNNKLPSQPGFPHSDYFNSLPATLDELMEYCCELQTRISLMAPGEDQIIKEYEEREKQIKKLKQDVNNSSNINKALEDKMNEIRSQWLPPLEELLRDINDKFGVMFDKLGCAGEVKLDKAGGDEDYDKYGIAILVRFRESEQLQQLTRHTQSGGERAITTALYLMALQTLSTVPFRCVDEINQGMDAINERKMIQLLMNVTTECDNAQYFLLTPKLLTDLEYNDKVCVHTIMNGKNVMNYKNWDLTKFIENSSNLTLC